MASVEQKLPTRARQITSTVIIGIAVLTFGVLMILAGTGNLPIEIQDFWFPALMFTLWAIGASHGLLRRNMFTLYFSYLFLVVGAVWLVHWFAQIEYSKLYPLYIAAPAVCSAGTWLVSHSKRFHLKSIVLFGGLALIFMLNSLGNLNPFITAGIALVMAGIFIFINVITYRRGSLFDGDRPQRARGSFDGDRPQRKK